MSKVLSLELLDKTFERLAEAATASGRTPEALAQACIEREVNDANGTAIARPMSRRRALMQLPIEERRRILEAQAEKLVAHYEQDAEWREFQGGDIVEY